MSEFGTSMSSTGLRVSRLFISPGASVSSRHAVIGETSQGRERHASERTQTRAVILAAGRGRRMGEMTEGRPKCLLPVGGQSLLEHQLATLSALGVAKITVVIGYCSDLVRESEFAVFRNAVAKAARTTMGPVLAIL